MAILIIGTGGTIAGQAAQASDHIGYRAGQIGVEQLVQALPELAGWPLRFEQLAQLDSKDMDFATWQRLVARVQAAQQQADVQAIVITHGTDTLEETAYLLDQVLEGDKPVVLTAAMRPASSRSPDGPQNLLDALATAADPRSRGVLVTLAGAVHAASRVRKRHSYRVDAFASEGGPLAWVENGSLRWLQPAPPPAGRGFAPPAEAGRWPRVEILSNAAGADGAVLPLLQQLAASEGRRLGVVAAGTGNGTLSAALEQALLRAVEQGVAVLRCTRCAEGPVLGLPGDRLPSAGALSAPQARVELLLRLL